MSENPFGTPPEEFVDFVVPSESDDPSRPIGRYDEHGNPLTNPATGAPFPNFCDVLGKVVALKRSVGPSGYSLLTLSFVVTDGISQESKRFAGREFDLYLSANPKARFKVVESYEALGLPLERPYTKSQAIGVYAILRLVDEEYEGRWSPKLRKISKPTQGAGYRGAASLSDVGGARKPNGSTAVAATVSDDIPF